MHVAWGAAAPKFALCPPSPRKKLTPFLTAVPTQATHELPIGGDEAERAPSE